MKTFRIQNEKCHECDSCHYKFNERYESTYGGYVSDCSYTVKEGDYVLLKPLYSPYRLFASSACPVFKHILVVASSTSAVTTRDDCS